MRGNHLLISTLFAVSVFLCACAAKDAAPESGPTGEWTGSGKAADGATPQKPLNPAIPHVKTPDGKIENVKSPAGRRPQDAARERGAQAAAGTPGSETKENQATEGEDEGGGGEEEESKLNAVFAVRQRAFQRMNEDGTVPPNAIWKAKLERDALLEAQGGMPAFDSTSWTALGPGNIGGRIRSILIHPTNTNTMWLGAVGGGVWKTTNGGSSWAPMDDFLPAIAIGCMILDHSNPNVLYAGTGEGFFEALEGSSNTATLTGAGIFKSTDGGLTWNQMPSTANWKFVNRISMHPTNSQTMLTATDEGIFLTTDGGTSWTKTHTAWTYDIDYNPTNPNVVVAGIHGGSGVIYSTNGGVTWTNSVGISGSHRCEVAWAPSAPNIVYAGVSASGRIKIYQSTLSGATFALKTSGNGITTYEAYNSALWVDPTNSNYLIVGGVYLYRSADAGVTLTSAFSNVHPDMHDVVAMPGFDGVNQRTVFFATDGGIYRASNVYTNTVSNLNNELAITQFYGGAMNNSTGVMIGGAQDNYTLRYAGNPNNWTPVIGGDGGFCAADQTNSNYFYGGYQWLGLRRSSNGGTSWTSITSGLSDSGGSNCNFISFFMLDPNEPNRMLVCARRLWRANNIRSSPPTWTIIKTAIGAWPDKDMGKAPPPAHMNDNNPFNISTVDIAKGNSNIIWVGHNNGEVYYTTNGTATSPAWTRVDNNPGPLPDRWVSRIVIDPNNHSRVYISFMGWAGNNIWMTENSGATFTQITGTGNRTIPTAPVSALALDPLKPGRLFAGTDIGIFTSWDNGQSWSVETQGPGTVPIDELVWRNSTQLLAVTHGRGMWQATVTPIDVNAQLNGFALIRGTLQSGGLAELMTSDDQRMDVRAQFLPGDLDQPVHLEVVGTAPQTIANTLTLVVESHVTLGGAIQTIQAYNYDTGQFVEVDQRITSSSDSVAEGAISTNVSSFIHPVTREVKMRVKVKPGVAFFSTNWNARFDRVGWRISN